MFVRRIFLLFVAVVSLASGQNSTDDLEVRVTLLENDVSVLQDELEEVETDNTLQDERLHLMEETVIENINDISDLDVSVDATEDAMILLQQRMAALEEMNNLLLERFDVLEDTVDESNQHIADLERASNSTDQELMELESVVNATNDSVENLEVEVQDANTRLVIVEESDADQDYRMTDLENTVDEWDDRIVSLEVANNDVQERLIVLEETISVPWTACASTPCTYGGTCIDVNVNTFVCMCRDGYFGITCEESYADATFLASVDHDPGTPSNPIVFNVARINTGGHYDAATGIYTVPRDGIYEFSVHIWSLDDATITVYLEVDDVPVAYQYEHDYNASDPSVDMSVILLLTAGQQVWVSSSSLVAMQGDDSSGMTSWFSGHLIHAT